MQNIEINTTQNVRITYEVAHLGDRMLAFVIDAAIVGGFALSCLIVFSADTFAYYLLAVPPVAFYQLISEITLKGQSIGKKALNIQVVKLNGTEAKASDYFFRWIFRALEIPLSFGTLATIFIATSKRGQRLGDLVSETSVIRIKPTRRMQFYEMMRNFQTESSYTPQFPQVKQLTETDMLFVQSVILRQQKHKNKAHEQILNELSTNLRQQLHIDAKELSNQKLLTTLLRDYIVLTR